MHVRLRRLCKAALHCGVQRVRVPKSRQSMQPLSHSCSSMRQCMQRHAVVEGLWLRHCDLLAGQQQCPSAGGEAAGMVAAAPERRLPEADGHPAALPGPQREPLPGRCPQAGVATAGRSQGEQIDSVLQNCCWSCKVLASNPPEVIMHEWEA